MNTVDQSYVGLPWKQNGTTREGLDCRGLAMLWAHEQMALDLPALKSQEVNLKLQTELVDQAQLAEMLKDARQYPGERGDVLFLRYKPTGLICHVAIYLGEDRYLHITRASTSRIENGLTLMRRLGFEPVGYLGLSESKQLTRALSEQNLAGPEVWIPIVLAVISLAASAAAAFLMPRPKLGKLSNQNGLYGFDQLFTESNPKLPLPDLLGAVTVAGNSPYQSIIDKSQTNVTDGRSQKANKIVILGSGPISGVTNNGSVIKINGRPYTDTYWHPSAMALNPVQVKAEAVNGLIGSDASRPSVTVYPGTNATNVPVDVRAHFDRNFPVYGFNGAAYAVFRLIDTTKFDKFNLTVTVQGRLCRTFNSSGFILSTATGESLTGAHSYSGQAVTADTSTDKITLAAHALSNGDAVTVDATTTMPGGLVPGMVYYVVNKATNDFQLATAPGGTAIDINTTNGSGVKITSAKTRFKLAFDDVYAVTSLTVGGTAYSEISAGAQTGNVYVLNKSKGYVEFLTAPANGTSISVTYQYYPRTWTQNPASHLVYLLTEPIRGKGFPASKIDWASAVALYNYCAAMVSWIGASRSVSEPRYLCNYAIDVYKPIQEHVRAVLDACYSYLFISNGKFVMRPRKAESSVFSFNMSNILVEGEPGNQKSTFFSELQERASQANQIKAFYHAKDTYNAETGVQRDDIQNQEDRKDWVGNLGIVDETLRIQAVDSEGQAERLAETILRENIGSNYLCEFKTTIKGLALEPGDVTDVTHASQPTWAGKLFRIEDISYDPQDYMALKCSEYYGAAYI